VCLDGGVGAGAVRGGADEEAESAAVLHPAEATVVQRAEAVNAEVVNVVQRAVEGGGCE